MIPKNVPLALAVFALAALAQWIVPLAGVRMQERILARGKTVRVRCAAPDPYDPFRGRYLAVRPEEATVPPPPGLEVGVRRPVWATLAADADGLSRVVSLSLEPVSGPDVIRLVAMRFPFSGESSTLEWPFERYYLDERLAPGADAIVARALRSEEKPVAEFRLLDGRAVLVDVLVGGESIRELARGKAAERAGW